MPHTVTAAILLTEEVLGVSDVTEAYKERFVRWIASSLAWAGVEHLYVVGPKPAFLGEFDMEVEHLGTPARDATGTFLLSQRDRVGRGPVLMVAGPSVVTPELAADMRLWPVDADASCALVCSEPQEGFQDVSLDMGVVRFDEQSGKLGAALGWYVAGRSFFDALESLQNGHPISVHEGLVRLAQDGELEGYRARLDQWLGMDATSPDVTALLRHRPGCTKRPGDSDRVLGYIEGILSEKKGLHYTLMNPGPVLTTAKVKSALVHHDICHRDEEFPKVVRRLRRKLRRVFQGGPEHEVVVLTGSGTSGMEAAIASSVPQDKKVLVVANGAFGERFMEIAKLHRLNLVPLHYPWGTLVDPADVERMLVEDPDIAVVAMCHHETSVGLLNPITEVGEIVRRHDRLFVVDSVASLGAEDLDVQRDKIDICVSSANKALHAISGLAVACVSRRAWDRIEDVPARVYYLNLKRYRDYAVEKEETPFTPAVSSFFALDAAVDEILSDGLEARWATYRRRNQRIRSVLVSRFGLKPLTDTGYESATINCVEVPDYISFAELYDEMKRRGYLIYNSKEHLKDRYFQVANMGDLSDETIDAFLGSLEMVLTAAARRSRATAVHHETRPAVEVSKSA